MPQLVQAIDAARGPPPVPPGLSAAATALLNAMLQPDPAQRLTIEELARHPFLTSPSKGPAVGATTPAAIAGDAAPYASIAVARPSAPAHAPSYQAGVARAAAPSTAGPPPPAPAISTAPAVHAAWPADSAAVAVTASDANSSAAEALAWQTDAALGEDAGGRGASWERLDGSPLPAAASPLTPASTPPSAPAPAHVHPVASPPHPARASGDPPVAAAAPMAALEQELEQELEAMRRQRDEHAASRARLRACLETVLSMLPARTSCESDAVKPSCESDAVKPSCESDAVKPSWESDAVKPAPPSRTAPSAHGDGRSASERGGGKDVSGSPAAAAPAAAPPAAACPHAAHEQSLGRLVLAAARRAHRLYQGKLEEARGLRDALRRQAERSGVVTSGFKFDDRVLFVRRTLMLATGVGAAATPTATTSTPVIHGPAYVAVREAGGGGAPTGGACFLSRASEESLSRSLRGPAAPWPAIVVGKVVHIERLVAPLDAAAAAAAGVRPGEAYALITAEIHVGDLAPELCSSR